MSSSPKILSQCPVCATLYAEDSIGFVGEQGKMRLYHCVCKACGNSMLTIVVDGGMASSLGLVTDLELEDALQARSRAAISTDECVAFHDLIDQKSRDFCRSLLGQA